MRFLQAAAGFAFVVSGRAKCQIAWLMTPNPLARRLITSTPSPTRLMYIAGIARGGFADFSQVRYMWHGSLGLPKVLFFALRYGIFVNNAFAFACEPTLSSSSWLILANNRGRHVPKRPASRSMRLPVYEGRCFFDSVGSRR